MERRLAQLAALAAFTAMLTRLGRLMQVEPGQINWRAILIASVVLGALVWWLASQVIRYPNVALFVFTSVSVILFLRVGVPETLAFGFLPGPETAQAVFAEMADAVAWIRHGVPPIVPTDGVVAILSVTFFSIGAFYAWGAEQGSVAPMVLPSIVLYVQFAVFDRKEAEWSWLLVAGVVLALAVTASAFETTSGVGRARTQEGIEIPKRSLTGAMAVSLAVALTAASLAHFFGPLVPDYRVARNTGIAGTGLLGGGASFDRWVDLRQSILNPTNAVVFTAALAEGSPPAGEIYWRMETLDTFDGVEWRRSDDSSQPYEPGSEIGEPSDAYLGTNAQVLHRVRAEALRRTGGLVPTAGMPLEIRSLPEIQAIAPGEFRILDDGAILYQPGLRAGDTYEVASLHADVRSDLGALATAEPGVLSPMFSAAAEAGAWTQPPSEELVANTELEDSERYRALPLDTPPAIFEIAREKTAGATTDFERAWMLQYWFRDSGEFFYSQEVTTGHRSLDLAAWLNNPTSLNFRQGYCEQFAASMAVLARALGMESRVVWGFTPGTSAEGGTQVIVRDANAHAWVEIWIDGFGWVPFEPTPRAGFVLPSLTASVEPLTFAPPPVGTTTQTTTPQTVPIPQPTANGTNFPDVWAVVVAGIAALVASVPMIKSIRRRRRLLNIDDGSFAAAWEEIVDRLTDIGERVPPSKTPLEVARHTDHSIVSIATDYSAEIYGGYEGRAARTDLLAAEAWLANEYGVWQRARGRLNPRSLVSRR